LSMTRSTHKLKSNETDQRFVNSLINSLPVEAHVSGCQYCIPDHGGKRINPLDAACRDHDIVYERSKHLDDRHKAEVLENLAWERFKAKDTSRKEKLVAYAVINVMKAKRKIGMGCKAAKKKRTSKKKNNGKRLISTPGETGGVVPSIPIFAGLSALGSLMSGGASVYYKKKIIIITLPDRPLSAQDIIKYVRKFKINHFRGVFLRNSLPKEPHVIECGILNLDISSGDESHWVTFHKNKNKVIYFDSFGDLPPPIELQRYFKKFKIVNNFSNYQDFNTFNCRYLCLDFLQCFNWKFDCIDCKLFSISKRLRGFRNSFRNKYKLHIFEFYLKEGCYDIEDINNKIAKETYIKCNGILQFNTPYSIPPVFGFKKIKCGPFHEARRSDKSVNLNTINSIKVLCNIAHESFNNQLQSHSMYEFSRVGKQKQRLNKTDINSITVQLVDENNNPIDNFNETLTVVLQIKHHGSH
ncbi:hypothetical protein AGLY_017171, partial [Aphis glycines]